MNSGSLGVFMSFDYSWDHASVTAQDVFKVMIQWIVAPALRELGFKGSGHVFELPDERFWVLLGFQRSRASDRFRVKFTINLYVVGKGKYAEARNEASYLPRRPTPSISNGPGWWRRIGQLVPGARGDLWWTISERDRPRHVAEQVLQTVTEYGLPAMRAQMSSA
jgi:uncharacterized protein DUF4304